MLFDKGHIRHCILSGTFFAFQVRKNAAEAAIMLSIKVTIHTCSPIFGVRTRDWRKSATM